MDYLYHPECSFGDVLFLFQLPVFCSQFLFLCTTWHLFILFHFSLKQIKTTSRTSLPIQLPLTCFGALGAGWLQAPPIFFLFFLLFLNLIRFIDLSSSRSDRLIAFRGWVKPSCWKFLLFFKLIWQNYSVWLLLILVQGKGKKDMQATSGL